MFVDANTRVNVQRICTTCGPLLPSESAKGLMPVIFTAFLMAHKANLALYKNSIFISARRRGGSRRVSARPDRTSSMRWIVIDEQKSSILAGIAKILSAGRSDRRAP